MISSGSAMEVDFRVRHHLRNGITSKTSKRALWDDIKKDYFVNLLCQYVSHSPKRNSWNRETWEKIREEMKERFAGSNISTEQLRQLERDLKKLYKSIKHIESQPGFRWDHDNKMLEASDNDWQKLFKADPKARKWHSKMLPYYSGLDTLYKGAYEIEYDSSTCLFFY
ncbi:hypothetical protein LUZ60_007946 [Juncus effusus]|nr:hypothetical protein LUZ60_007946 [Juncus effusus]